MYVVPSGNLPSASSIETYFSMSRTLLHAPPAGRAGMMASLTAVMALAVWPSASWECEPAWFPASARCKSNVVDVICSGSKTYLHRPIVGSAQLRLGIQHVGTCVTGGCRHEIGILKQFAELRSRLHRP